MVPLRSWWSHSEIGGPIHKLVVPFKRALTSTTPSLCIKNNKIAFDFRVNLPFQQAQHMGNPWNDNKKLQICRDGQVSKGHTGVIRSQISVIIANDAIE